MTSPFDQPPVLAARRIPRQISVRVDVSVDNNHCHLYAICQQEAPKVFELRRGRRLVVDTHPPAAELERVRSAARLCPMQAIVVAVRP